MNKNDLFEKNASREVLAAEQQAEQSRRNLESSLDRLVDLVQGAKTGFENKVESAAHAVEEKSELLRSKLDDGVVQIDLFIAEGKQIVDQTLSHMDQVVGGLFKDINSTLDQVQGAIGRVKGKVDGILSEADLFLGRVEKILVDVRGDISESSESVFTRGEKVVQKFRTQLSSGTGEINQMIDRAEQTIREISDPVSFVRKNPRLAISVLVFGGVLVGVFFRKIFPENSSSQGAASFKIDPESSTLIATAEKWNETHEAA